MSDNQQQNWVKARSQCTIEYWFEKLVSIIENDVKKFNNLPEEKKKNVGRFDCKRTNKSELSICEYDEVHHDQSEDTISIQKNTNCIYAFRNENTIYKLEPQWNPKTMTCDLLVNGESYELWELSQLAVGDFLFEKI